ncbi:MAG: beta-ketoacyl-[acyl-carrier-protein] synthase family protein [Pseudomonas sp.]|nr:beta-ketoacyl-[acyl-carrier-protein] synthase family protein [Pseudomonas sp.]
MTMYLQALGLNCALGHDKTSVAQGLFAGDCSGMQPVFDWVPEQTLLCGQVQVALPELDEYLQVHATRNNQLLMAAALQIIEDINAVVERYGRQRVAVIIGTSTSGIHEAGLHIAERARNNDVFPTVYNYHQQELADPAVFLSRWLQLSGPSYSISTACTSGARALISAQRMLKAGLCDAVLCGGADSLCRLTLNGFSSLEALSADLCNPFSLNRHGINIGEGAALFLMTREALSTRNSAPLLAGVGASSDAYHISAPQPQGLGASQAMRAALADAQLPARAISYINLHGTATQHNDAMESHAVYRVFADRVPCSSTKPMTGHTLGAAGALEAAFCWLSLHPEYNPQALLPAHIWDGCVDEALAPIQLCDRQQRLAIMGSRWLMSNSFAFGGNNTSLILGEAPC